MNAIMVTAHYSNFNIVLCQVKLKAKTRTETIYTHYARERD